MSTSFAEIPAHRRTAGGKLQSWRPKRELVDAIAGRTTLAGLIRKFEAAGEGKPAQRKNADRTPKLPPCDSVAPAFAPGRF